MSSTDLQLRYHDRDDQAIVLGRVRRAETFWQRFRGLMGRANLAPGEGLLLAHTSSIHMLFMRFPIDCVFLGPATENGAQVVVAVRHSLPPWRGVVWWVRGARDVLELPAGTLRSTEVQVGDVLRLEPVS